MPKSAEELFAAALALADPAERAALLERECADNSELRREVESLLAAHEQAIPYFNQPTVALDVSLEKPGDKIGRYKLLQRIGEGGCGVVYMAEQEEPIRRRVALKVIKLGMDTRQVIARFEAERQALALMDHPNIAKVLDAGATQTGRPYFVMELVRGIKITDYCDQNSLSTRDRLDLFIQICQAVQHAHQKGIIHRDIKPSNILVTLHDGVPVPKVIDFGIAKATTGQRLTDKTLFTAFEQFIGTPAYMSPEQAEMSGLDVDTRSDIYSLGVLLYELLTSKTPFDANELLKAGLDEMRRRIRETDPPRPSTRLTMELAAVTATRESAARQTDGDSGALTRRRYNRIKDLIPLVRGDLDWIVMKALEKDRTRRYETANGLASDVKRHLTQEPVQARPPSRLYRLHKFARRNKVTFTAATAIAAVLVIAAVISSWQAIRAMRAQRHAQSEANRAGVEAARARQAEQNAVEKATLAENEKRRADESAEELRRNLYAADMSAASAAWEKGDIGLMRKLLEAHRPKRDEADLRGFEWFYFWKLSKGEQEELVAFETNESTGDRPMKISSDGSLVAMVRTNELHVQNWRTQQSIAKWSLPDRPNWTDRDGDFSPDNKFVATLELDGLHLFELSTLRERTLPTGDCDWLAFAPAGRLVAVNLRQKDPTQPGFIKIWEYESGTQVRTISSPAWLESWGWSSDGKKFYKYHTFPSGSLTVEDIESGTSTFYDFPGFDGLLSLSPDFKTVVCFDVRGELSVIDFESRRILATSQGFPGGQTSSTFSPDCQWFTATGPDNKIVVWETTKWNKVATLRGHSEDVSVLSFLPHDNRLVSLGSDNTIRVWKFGESSDLTHLTNNIADFHEAYPIQFSPDARFIALPIDTFMTNSETVLWDTRKGKVKSKLRGLVVAFSPDGTQLLLRDHAGRLQLCDAESLKINREFYLGPSTNAFTTLSLDGRYLAFQQSEQWASRYRNHSLEIYNASGQRIHSIQAPVRAWEFSPDGQLLAINDGWGVNDSLSTLLLEALNAPVERRVKNCGAACIAFSPDNRWLAAGAYPPGVNQVDVEQGTLVAKLKGHQTLVTAVAFSPDGKTIASGAQDRTIRLYNVATRRQVAVFQAFNVVLSLAFSPDGQTLLSGEVADKTGPGQYRFWHAPRVEAPSLPLPALPPPAPDSLWVMAPKLKDRASPGGRGAP